MVQNRGIAAPIFDLTRTSKLDSTSFDMCWYPSKELGICRHHLVWEIELWIPTVKQDNYWSLLQKRVLMNVVLNNRKTLMLSLKQAWSSWVLPAYFYLLWARRWLLSPCSPNQLPLLWALGNLIPTDLWESPSPIHKYTHHFPHSKSRRCNLNTTAKPWFWPRVPAWHACKWQISRYSTRQKLDDTFQLGTFGPFLIDSFSAIRFVLRLSATSQELIGFSLMFFLIRRSDSGKGPPKPHVLILAFGYPQIPENKTHCAKIVSNKAFTHQTYYHLVGCQETHLGNVGSLWAMMFQSPESAHCHPRNGAPCRHSETCEAAGDPQWSQWHGDLRLGCLENANMATTSRDSWELDTFKPC
jgi:hypothetical protein